MCCCLYPSSLEEEHWSCSSGPFGKEVLEQTIRKSGIEVETNLKGLDSGFSAVNGEPTPDSPSEPASEPLGETQATQRRAAPLLEQVHQQFPETLQELVSKGVLRTVDFQDQKYGMLYLEQLRTVFDLEKDAGAEDYLLTRKAMKNLALWMA